jgi:tetratricopeptide (TPR) repeat protein
MTSEDFGFSILDSRLRAEAGVAAGAGPRKLVRSLALVQVLGLLLGLDAPARARAATVRAWEGTLDLPTYALGEEDPNPAFPLARGHRIYPYTMLDNLTDRLETHRYQAVFLENEYLKATVLPSLGGRLYSLYDKVSGREVFYRNHVVKYGLVGLRGAWISGGVEFNFPDGHTTVTVSPVAWALRQNPDGSATVTVGDMDRVTGMHWEVALTLRPGEARLEQRVTLFNPTPLSNLYWYWANAAVPATEDMSFDFPMREAYPHARWPVFTYPIYQGVIYSSYRETRQPTSLFGRQVHRNFFGAYYQSADYGVVHVADFREVPGKKTWTWGVAGDGLIWTELLTDHDGPYNEIQAGRYETQLNYEFMAPRRVESWTEYWYPVRGLGGGVVEATGELAVNARFQAQGGAEPPPFKIQISPTMALDGVRVRLKSGFRTVREFGPVKLEPLEPAVFEVPVKDINTDPRSLPVNLVVEVESSSGGILARWSSADPVDGNVDFVPAAGAPKARPPDPEKMTVEEMFFFGVGQEKDGQEEAAQKTYERVLARDPGYIPALVKQAWWRYRAADLPGAESSIARAMARDAFDPAVHYAAGVIYRAAGRPTLAADAFWAAIHYGGPPAPAFAQLGELAIRRKDYEEAARLLRQALKHNPDDVLARTDLAVAWRLAGIAVTALKAADESRERMPLLPFALAERWREGNAQGDGAQPGESGPLFARPDVQDYLEVAAWYRGLADYPSADAVLERALKELSAGSLSPLVYYYLASDARREQDAARASQAAAQAAAASYVKVFPQRLADAQVLAEAVTESPLDARAKYYLGNFFFAHGRYQDAATLWFQALGEGFDYAVLDRNLGLYAWLVKRDRKAAAGFYAKAIQLAPDDYRLYTDLDEIYAQLGETARRAELFAKAPTAVLDQDTVRVRRALLLVEQRHYDQALSLLTGHHFKPWEGGAIVRRIYVFANLEEGKSKLRAGKAPEAEAAFRHALEYPANLGVGKPDKPHDEQALYWLGGALEAEAKHDAARQSWQQAVAEDKAADPFGRESGGESQLYAALALNKLGQSSEAEKILNELASGASKPKPGAHDLYIAGLVERARHREERARNDFRRALEMDPSLWQARLEL